MIHFPQGTVSAVRGAFLVCTALAVRTAACQTVRLSAEPILTIGRSDSTTEFVGLVAVTRLSTGEIAVVNGQPPEIRLFSPSGKFLRLLARPGSGPGELASPYWFGRSGDSLMTYDVSLARLTIYSTAAHKISTLTFQPRGAPGRMAVIGYAGSGTWLVSTLPSPFPPFHADGQFRDSTTIGLWSGDTTTVRLIGRFPNFSLFAYNAPGTRATSTAFDRLGANTVFHAAGQRIWIGDPYADQLMVYTASGHLGRRVRVPVQRKIFAPSAVEKARDAALAAVRRGLDSARIRAQYDVSKRSGPAPAFSRIVPGAANSVWLEEFRELRSDATEYLGLDSTGARIGHLQGPPGVRFHEIGAAYAIGVLKDPDGVDMVVLYRIIR